MQHGKKVLVHFFEPVFFRVHSFFGPLCEHGILLLLIISFFVVVVVVVMLQSQAGAHLVMLFCSAPKHIVHYVTTVIKSQ